AAAPSTPPTSSRRSPAWWGSTRGASGRARRSRSTSSRSSSSWSGHSFGSCGSRPTDGGGEAPAAPEVAPPPGAPALPPVRDLSLLSHDADLAEAGQGALRPVRGAAHHPAGADARALHQAAL